MNERIWTNVFQKLFPRLRDETERLYPPPPPPPPTKKKNDAPLEIENEFWLSSDVRSEKLHN